MRYYGWLVVMKQFEPKTGPTNIRRGLIQTIRHLDGMPESFWKKMITKKTRHTSSTKKHVKFPSMHPILAHLSRRLMGELIVYQSIQRPSVVCRSSVRPQFQTSSPLKPLGQLNSNFIWRLLRKQEQKFVQMVLVT